MTFRFPYASNADWDFPPNCWLEEFMDVELRRPVCFVLFFSTGGVVQSGRRECVCVWEPLIDRTE